MKSTQTRFQVYLQNTAGELEKELKIFTKVWRKQINGFSDLQKLNQYFTESLFGGKMLRGTLVKLGYELVTKSNNAILKPAAAFEILHTALLIHDDIIDQSPVRRGKPALHIRTKNKQYGISQAICLGDIGITHATKQIAESDFPTDAKNKAVTYFQQVISDTILGEMLDVASSQSLKRTEKQILHIHKMKTAQYTIIGPLTLGAILGGAPDSLLKSLKLFGEHLGIGYQLQDDILGVFGDEKKIGKSTTSDIEENKSTILITYAIKHANTQQRIALTNYGKKGIRRKEQELIKKVFIETGALAYSQNMIDKQTTKAKEYIPKLTHYKTKQQLFFNLADMLIERVK